MIIVKFFFLTELLKIIEFLIFIKTQACLLKPILSVIYKHTQVNDRDEIEEQELNFNICRVQDKKYISNSHIV